MLKDYLCSVLIVTRMEYTLIFNVTFSHLPPTVNSLLFNKSLIGFSLNERANGPVSTSQTLAEDAIKRSCWDINAIQTAAFFLRAEGGCWACWLDLALEADRLSFHRKFSIVSWFSCAESRIVCVRKDKWGHRGSSGCWSLQFGSKECDFWSWTVGLTEI